MSTLRSFLTNLPDPGADPENPGSTAAGDPATSDNQPAAQPEAQTTSDNQAQRGAQTGADDQPHSDDAPSTPADPQATADNQTQGSSQAGLDNPPPSDDTPATTADPQATADTQTQVGAQSGANSQLLGDTTGTQVGDQNDAIPTQATNNDPPKKAADAGTDEVPTFKPTSPVPFDVRADTVDEFVQGSNSALGGGGEVGHMQASDTESMETDGNGKVSKVNMTVETSIVRPRWAGGRPKTDQEKALIKKAEQLIKEHEERHREIAKDYMTRAVKAAVGKSGKDAQKAIDKQIQEMNTAQKALDSKEGALVVVHGGPNGAAGPATDVKLGPATGK